MLPVLRGKDVVGVIWPLAVGGVFDVVYLQARWPDVAKKADVSKGY